MSLLIGAETVDIKQSGHNHRQVPLGPAGRGYNRKMLSAVTSTRGYRKVWRLETVEMDLADVIALEAELAGPGAVNVSGSLVGTNIKCHAANVRRGNYDSALLTASLSFELLASDLTAIGYVWPEDLGNGRFGLSATDTGLRFIDLGNGRFGVDAAGTIIGRITAAGRFTLETE